MLISRASSNFNNFYSIDSTLKNSRINIYWNFKKIKKTQPTVRRSISITGNSASNTGQRRTESVRDRQSARNAVGRVQGKSQTGPTEQPRGPTAHGPRRPAAGSDNSEAKAYNPRNCRPTGQGSRAIWGANQQLPPLRAAFRGSRQQAAAGGPSRTVARPTNPPPSSSPRRIDRPVRLYRESRLPVPIRPELSGYPERLDAPVRTSALVSSPLNGNFLSGF